MNEIVRIVDSLRVSALVMLGAALLVVAIPSGIVAAQPAPVTLMYGGNLDGELEPCGCAETGNMGGLKRHVTVIDDARRIQPDLLLISSGGLLSSVHAHERITGDFILQGIAKMGYDAVGVQWTDLAYGAPFVAPYGLPWVSSNWRGDTFAPERIVEKQGRRFAVFSWLDPDTSPQADVRAGGNPVDARAASVMTRIRAARAGGAVTILLTTLSTDKAATLFDLSSVDILFVESGYEKYAEPVLKDGTLILRPGSRGMRFGRLGIEFAGSGRIASFTHDVITMPPDVADSPRMQDWYVAYNAAIKAAYERSVAVRKAADSGSRPYVGVDACKACHAQEHAVWSQTKHARAYDALDLVGKAFDEDCIGCHTVGFNRDGGFIDKDVTSHLANVQCESCHGPGRTHAASGGKERTAHADWQPAQMCGQCHVPKHSPEFDLNRYWPRIDHHRAKAAMIPN